MLHIFHDCLLSDRFLDASLRFDIERIGIEYFHGTLTVNFNCGQAFGQLMIKLSESGRIIFGSLG
ncbi:hypothetical protein PISMIDRAFT_519491 [Pisolithus microcarpus 441]|uniref:Uncharacterized protein n=1 Tax=Pisolithus microcarpus 441 TaxID=765257 RepID=A0A0C9ZIT3_9AGAM|nr:hypothetical protein PISMIDRAFT_519491 [Pisolithus microcarpus 441]